MSIAAHKMEFLSVIGSPDHRAYFRVCYGYVLYFKYLQIKTCFMDFVWAADPTRDTDRPTLMAGRIPELNKSILTVFIYLYFLGGGGEGGRGRRAVEY